MPTDITPATDAANAKAEFWGDLQVDFYTKTSTLFLANRKLEDVLSTNGRKAYKPILSQPSIRTYVPHTDMTFDTKKVEKQYLEVDTFPSAAEVIDITESSQSPYDLIAHSGKAIREGLMNRTEQIFLSKIANAGSSINGGNAFALSPTNVGDVIQEADGTVGAFDVPEETAMRAMLVGPRTKALMQKVRGDRETPMGDEVDARGVMKAWKGWTPVVSNNLPWSGTLTIATTPQNGDQIIILGRKFEARTTVGTGTTGTIGVAIGGSASAFRTNLKHAIEGTGTIDTNYTQLDNVTAFMLRNKRQLAVTISGNDMLFTGFGDILVSETLTDPTDGWSALRQKMAFMMRGSIDLVMQFMEIEIPSAESRFAKKPKGLIGVGAKVFQDGAMAMVNATLDVSGWGTVGA